MTDAVLEYITQLQEEEEREEREEKDRQDNTLKTIPLDTPMEEKNDTLSQRLARHKEAFAYIKDKDTLVQRIQTELCRAVLELVRISENGEGEGEGVKSDEDVQ